MRPGGTTGTGVTGDVVPRAAVPRSGPQQRPVHLCGHTHGGSAVRPGPATGHGMPCAFLPLRKPCDGPSPTPPRLVSQGGQAHGGTGGGEWTRAGIGPARAHHFGGPGRVPHDARRPETVCVPCHPPPTSPTCHRPWDDPTGPTTTRWRAWRSPRPTALWRGERGRSAARRRTRCALHRHALHRAAQRSGSTGRHGNARCGIARHGTARHSHTASSSLGNSSIGTRGCGVSTMAESNW